MKNKLVTNKEYESLLNKVVTITLDTGEVYIGVLMYNSPLQITINVNKIADVMSSKASTNYTVHIAKKGVVSIKK